VLSSVPITIGKEEYRLQYQHGDVAGIEEKMGVGLPFLLDRKQMGVRTATIFIQYALKKEKEGKLVRVCPLTQAGLEQAEDLVMEFTKGRDMLALIDLFNKFIQALVASGWFTGAIQETPEKEVEVDPSKKLEKKGSKRPNV
jgi:hypothetical protein